MQPLGEKIGVLAVALTMLSIGSSPHPFILILCYIIHELGHILFSRLMGAKIRKMKVGCFHLSLSYDCTHLTYPKEILVQGGGIIFNLASALIISLLPLGKNEAVSFFVLCSLSLAIMNLYPISILDGGGILKSVLLMIFPQHVAEKIIKAVSFLGVILMWLLAVYLQLVFSSNLSLFFISAFLLIELCFSTE